MKVTVVAKIGDAECELGWAELDSADDPNLPGLLRGIADEIERTRGQDA